MSTSGRKGPSIGHVICARREELGLDIGALASITQIPSARLETLEAAHDQEPTFTELGQLSRFLGVDLELYDPEEDEAPEALPEIVTLLKSNEEYLPHTAWPTIVSTSEIARACAFIETQLKAPPRLEALRQEFSKTSISTAHEPWQQGERLAGEVRAHLDLHGAPISSMYGLCRDLGILIIEAFLPASVSALCMADAAHGPTIIINTQAANDALGPRRFALAHEVCHILFDEHEMDGLQRFDHAPGFFEARHKPDIEKRADAFAIHLLCPAAALRAEWARAEQDNLSLDACMRRSMERFGVSFTALRYHLQNLGLLSHEQAERITTVNTDTPPHIEEAERAANPTAYMNLFDPLARPRRGEFLRHVINAYRAQLITRSAVLNLLDIDGATLEAYADRWLDFFAKPQT